MTTSLSLFNLGTLEMKTEELLLTDVHALRAQRFPSIILLGNSWKTLKISDIRYCLDIFYLLAINCPGEACGG
jgi:hypothetical protein